MLDKVPLFIQFFIWFHTFGRVLGRMYVNFCLGYERIK